MQTGGPQTWCGWSNMDETTSPATPPRPLTRAQAAVATHSFVFVVHGGNLETKSALLACSLRQKLRVGQRILAVEMRPDSRWAPLSDAARALFDRLGVETVTSENRVAPDYAHGNKIDAMASVDGPAIFLDSDMLMMRPFITHHSILGADCVLKVADIDTFVRGGGAWSRAYRMFGLPLPDRSMTATATGERMRPYYNAGFICVKNGRDFAECWLDTAQGIENNPEIVNKRPWLDQVALPVALARLGWTVTEASTLMNFPAHLHPVAEPLPYIVHYHFPRIVAQTPRLLGDVRFYMGKFPELRQVLAADPEWEAVTG